MNTPRLNILLADDDADDCRFFHDALTEIPQSTQLTIVSDGEMLMNYLFENSESPPHILFLDINMPRKDGFQCLHEMKQNEKLKEIPIVMLSTSNLQNKIRDLFEAGADIFVRKPNSHDELVQVIHHAIPIASNNSFSHSKIKYILNA